jgi:hypothetical protein
MNSMIQVLRTGTRAIRTAATAFAAIVIFSTQAHAASTIAYWTLDGIPSVSAALPGANAIPTSFSPDTGSGTLYIAPDHTGTAGTGIKGNVDDATGTVVNNAVTNYIASGPPLNTAEAFLNGVTGNVLVGNGGYIEIQFTMAGQTNIGISYASLASSAGAFNNNQWSFSTDGTTFTNFGGAVTTTGAIGPNHITTGGYSLVGPLIASGLDNYSGTAYLRYTFNGASGTAATPLNRIDNLLLQSGASPATPSNPASLPIGGDIVFGLNNADATNTLELVRGSAAPSGGVRYPGPWQSTPFIEAVKFDNYGGVAHNAKGNLIGINFGPNAATGGTIYNLATTGSNPAPSGQALSTTAGTRVAGLSVSPNNNKIAVVGTDAGKVIVFDYTPGNTQGSGAALANRRDSAVTLITTTTQGTVWKDNSTVLAFTPFGSGGTTTPGNIYPITDDGTNLTVGAPLASVQTPALGSNYTSLAYNPAISPYLYALYSGFATAASPQSQTRLYVFDPTNNYSLLTTQTSGGLSGVDLSQSTQTGRDIALDKNGNLFIGAFDSTITYLPAADFANPAAIAAIPASGAGISTFYYGSTYDATAFPGMDIGFAAPGITGDYNNDGKVDAADYVMWRKAQGTTTVLANDPVGGTIGTAQYNNWRANFGNPPGAGSGLGGASVPEPASFGLLLIGLVALCSRRRIA